MSGNKQAEGVILQARDRRLLAELTVMRVVDRELTKVVAGFQSTTRANARLLKLTHAGLLNRFFVGSIAAGRKAIYTQTAKGAAVIGAPFRGITRRYGKTLVGDLFVAHQTQINEIYATVKHRTLPTGSSFIRSRTFTEPLTEANRLIPDGYFELQTPGGIRSAFLEVDLGSETLKIWEQKIRSYLQIAVSGEFTRLFRQPQFRVLVVANSERRQRSIRAAITKQTDKIFWLSDLETINRAGFWSAVWLRPKGGQMLSLL
jgi:hypothetical protein